MTTELVHLFISAATLVVMALMLYASVRDRITANKRRKTLRKHLDKHYPKFEKDLAHQIWSQTMDPLMTNDRRDSAEILERSARVSKITRDFIENLNPENEKERGKLSIAVERYVGSMWKHMSSVDGAIEDVAISRSPPDKEKIILEELEERQKVFGTELYHDILYKDG